MFFFPKLRICLMFTFTPNNMHMHIIYIFSNILFCAGKSGTWLKKISREGVVELV